MSTWLTSGAWGFGVGTAVAALVALERLAWRRITARRPPPTDPADRNPLYDHILYYAGERGGR